MPLGWPAIPSAKAPISSEVLSSSTRQLLATTRRAPAASSPGDRAHIPSRAGDAPGSSHRRQHGQVARAQVDLSAFPEGQKAVVLRILSRPPSGSDCQRAEEVAVGQVGPSVTGQMDEAPAREAAERTTGSTAWSPTSCFTAIPRDRKASATRLDSSREWWRAARLQNSGLDPRRAVPGATTRRSSGSSLAGSQKPGR